MNKEDVNVLIVEDESIVAHDIRTMLENMDYNVVAIESRGEDVPDRVKKHNPDIVLMDINLAGERSGIETAQKLKDQFGLSVIFLTAHTSSDILDQAKKVEPLGFLNKPIDESDLRSTLRVGSYRRQIESELRLKDRALSAVEEGITITDPSREDNPMIYANKGFQKMTGYDVDEILGRNCRFLQGPDTDPKTVEQIRKALEEDVHVTVEILNYTKNDKPFWNQLSITPLYNDMGELTHYVGIQKDITEMKRQEEELKEAEKLAAIGEMAAGMMHEINNPNAFIRGNIEFLKKGWQRLQDHIDTDEVDEDLEFILEETEDTFEGMLSGTNRIEQIVNKVKLFARRKSRPSEQETFLPGSYVTQALKSIPETEKPWFTITRGDDDQNEIKGDPSEFQQLVINLVENAIDAVSEVEDPEVQVESVVDDAYYLRVRDNGEGIPEDIQNKIFDPFFTTKATGEGTGLGLSIVRGIIDRMNAEVDLDSGPGEGTRFQVKIPLKATENERND